MFRVGRKKRTWLCPSHVSLFAGLAFACLAAGGAVGQDIAPFQRPGEERPELPRIEPPKEPSVFELPPVRPPPEGAPLGEMPTIQVGEIRVTGATIFSDEEFAVLTKGYTGRQVSPEELLRLRDELTLLYVNEGYLNSGAVLPDQEVIDGLVEYRIVEGQLTRIDLEGNRWFRDRYLRSRLELGAGAPLNVRTLEKALQLLQQDTRVSQINADLGPGDLPGEGVLRVRIREELPFRTSLQGDNHTSPSISAYGGEFRLSHENLTGFGDRLTFIVGRTHGLEDYEGRYEIPLNPFDTTLGVRYRYATSQVREQPFEALDIESKSEEFGIWVRQPLFRSYRSSFELSLTGEYRESETSLLGRPFSFTAGAEDGRSKVSVIRFGQNWLYRDLSQVIAARSTISVGIDAFDATVKGGAIEDGLFLAWLGQFQWARRFERLFGLQLVFRTDVQLSESALLSLEQFAVGGATSVRGYRENQLVRDNGAVSSLELRIPLWTDSAGRSMIQLAPFFDIGRSWNTDRDESKPKTIYSAGVGLRFSFTDHLFGDIYWAEDLRDVFTPDDRDLQDTGVHFRVVLAY